MRITKTFGAFVLAASLLFFGCKPKDADLQAKITEKLTANPDLSGVTAAVTGGIVNLSGEVKDDAARQLADSAARNVKGVKSVVDNITVAPPPPPPPVENPDSALMQGVTDATKDFPTVSAAVSNGEITLTGSIRRADLKKLMQSLNSLQPKKINNQLTIK